MTSDVLGQPRKFWMRWRVRLGYPLAVVYLALASPTAKWIAVGAAVAVVGVFIRGVAAGHLHKDCELATAGPYARSRNPLYLGSAFLALGFAIAGHSWWAGSLIMIYFAVFYYAVMKNEEADLHLRFGALFDDYAQRVPLFLPNVFRPRHAPMPAATTAQRFSWPQYQRNREYRALIGTMLVLFLVWLRMWVRQRYGI